MPRFRKSAQRPDVRFVAVDELGRRIQRAVEELEAAGELTRGDYDGPPPRFNGYCARMCQAYKFLSSDPRTAALATDGARPRYSWKRTRFRDVGTHYWIETRDGVMDLNFGPGQKPFEGFWPYTNEPRAANSWGFHGWKEDRSYPANLPARKIMDAVWAKLDEEQRT